MLNNAVNFYYNDQTGMQRHANPHRMIQNIKYRNLNQWLTDRNHMSVSAIVGRKTRWRVDIAGSS